ncbi:MAG TPA: flagellar hook protein FlgE [Polyangia bacterium]|nr:flagellar hook protein FlgE [Polyangia bacterium]
MSLISSLYTGATGLEANSTDLSVIGDNIANANTIGFKQSRAAFQDAMSQQMIGAGTALSQLGLGTRLEAVQKIITQGALTNTGLATDLAIDGNGFFVVSGAHNGTDGQFYTRAGQFTLDNTGTLVNLEGLHVQGYTANTAGVVGTTPGDLAFGDTAWPAVATTTVGLKGNLSATTPIPIVPFDPLNPSTTSQASSSVTVYDSLGTAHQVDAYFVKTAAGAWDWHAMTDGGGLTGGIAGTPTEIANGTMTFDTSGNLSAMTTAATNFNPLDAVNPQPLTFNFGDPTGAGGTGLLGLSQFANGSGMTQTSQDGFSAGSLTHVSIDKDGSVNGTFTNGQNRVLGRLATALVKAPDQMDRVGGNLFAATAGSGQATLGAAGSVGRGTIVAGALEQSNVDLANEFVRMIAAQRAYQANGKTITTADSLLQELMQIKR